MFLRKDNRLISSTSGSTQRPTPNKSMDPAIKSRDDGMISSSSGLTRGPTSRPHGGRTPIQMIPLFPLFPLLPRILYLLIILVLLPISSNLQAAGEQSMEFSGFVEDPDLGPYNQTLTMQVLIIKRSFDQSLPEEEREVIVWDRIYEEVPVIGGFFKIILEEDDFGRTIGASEDSVSVFESTVDYSFNAQDSQDLVRRSDFPEANYAIRVFMQRSLAEGFEQIKPDYNIDGFPFSISSIDLTGTQVKKGRLSIVYGSAEASDSGSVVHIDTLEGRDLNSSFGDLEKNQGAYLKNTTLRIVMQPTESNLAFDIEGTMYLKDSTANLEGNITLDEGNILLNSLCMAEDCEGVSASTKFPGRLFAFRSVQFNRFEDLDDPKVNSGVYAGVRYTLDPGGQTTFRNLSILNQSPKLGSQTLSLEGGSNLKLKGNSGLIIDGSDAGLTLERGNLLIEADISESGVLDHLDARNLHLSRFRLLNQGIIDPNAAPEYKNEKFFKLRAGKFFRTIGRAFLDDTTLDRAFSDVLLQNEYAIKPSRNSKFRAIKFYFEDFASAKLELDKRVERIRFPRSPNRAFERKAKVLFHPIFTEEILEALLGGETTNFHNHDLVSQADAEEILQIINDPKFTDETRISYLRIDPELARLPDQNIWEKQNIFNATGLVLESSFLVKKDLITSFGPQGSSALNFLDKNRVKVVFGDGPAHDFAYLGTLSDHDETLIEDFELYNPLGLMDFKANSLNVHGSIKMVPPTTATSSILDLWGELTVRGDVFLEGKIDARGQTIFGCFLNPADCPTDSWIQAANLENTNQLGSSIFKDLQDTSFLIDPNQSSVLNHLRLKNDLEFLGSSVIFEDELRVQSTLTADNGRLGTQDVPGFAVAPSFQSTSALFYTDPSSKSIWNSLELTDELKLGGNLNVLGEILIGGTIEAQSARISFQSTFEQGIQGSRFEDLDSVSGSNPATAVMNPDGSSTMNELVVEGELEIDGVLHAKKDLSVGSTLTLKHNLQNPDEIHAPSFFDENDTSFRIDPSGSSILNTLEVTSQIITDILTARSLTLGGELRVNQSASLSGPVTVLGETLIRSEISLKDQTSRVVFHVDALGNLTARSVRFNTFVKITDFVDLLGLLKVFGDVSIQDPSDFQGSTLSIEDSFSIIDSNNVPTFRIDAEGNINSIKGGAKVTGAVHFLLSSAKGVLLSDTWTLGTNNPDVRILEFEDSQGNGLNLLAGKMTSISTAQGSGSFSINDQVTMQSFLDSDDNAFQSRLNGSTRLNQLSVESTNPITIPSQALLIPLFSDLDDPKFFVDPSEQTKLRELSVDDQALLHSKLLIDPDFSETNEYDTKLLLLTGLTTPTAIIFKVDEDLSLSNQGNLTSSFDFDHTGKIELYRSLLQLRSGTSTTSVNIETMTTLVILPDQSFNETHQATFPEYFADHLHSHDQVAGINADQMAFRSQKNIFEGSNRFAAGADSVLMQPSLSITPTWARTNIANLNRFDPQVLPISPSAGVFGTSTGAFLIAGGTENQDHTNPNSTILSFVATAPNFESLSSHTNLGNNFGAYHLFEAENRIYHAGGIDGSGNLKDLLTYYNGTWATNTVPNPVAYSQLKDVNGNLYLFGGFKLENSKVYENDDNFVGTNGSLSKQSSNFPPKLQQRVDVHIYARGTTIYRNSHGFDSEQGIYSHGSNVFAPRLSRSAIDICFHDNSRNLHVYNLITETATNLSIQGHHCHWGPETEPDSLYYIAGTKEYGKLQKIDRDGNNSTTFAALSPYDFRRFQILSDGTLNLVGQSQVAGVPGERFLLKTTTLQVNAIDSDGTDQIVVLDSSLDVDYPKVHANQLYYLNSNASSNSVTNLFVSELDGSDSRQVTYFPQGINERPAFLESGEALLAVDAFHVSSSKLPTTYEQGCAASFHDKVYLFGAGNSEDQILEYDPDNDTFETLLETLPFDTPFSCTFDGSTNVYFQQGNTFWYYDLSQSRFWPLSKITGAETDSEGTLTYSTNTESVYFLEELTSTSAKFYEFDPDQNSWSTLASPNRIYADSTIAAVSDHIYLLGNRLATDSNQKFKIVSSTWSSISDSPVSSHHSFNLDILSPNQVFISGGLTALSPLLRAWIYKPDLDQFVERPALDENSILSGSYLHKIQQLYLFGGDGKENTLQIYPLNAASDTDFAQIMRLDLLSEEISHETSAPTFEHATVSPISSDVAYFEPTLGLRYYNPHTSTHSTLVNSTSADDVTGIALAPENDWVYFSNLDGSVHNIYRTSLDGSGLENLSNSSLTGVSGSVQFVSDDHERLYLITNSKPAQVLIHGGTPAREIGSSEITQFGFYSTTAVQELRDGVLYRSSIANLNSGSLDLNPREIREETSTQGLLLVQDVFEDSQGDFLISARRHFNTTNIYFLSDERENALPLTSFTDTDNFGFAPHRVGSSDAVQFTLSQTSSIALVSLENSTLGTLSNSSRENDSGSPFETGKFRNRSFTFDNRIYALLGNKIYRTQFLGPTATGLSWEYFDTQAQIDSNRWQVTQYLNRAFLYQEDSREIYRYFPDEKAMYPVGSVGSALETGTLAVAANPVDATKFHFYHVAGGSVAKLDTLSQPEGNLSFEIYSSSQSTAESEGLKVLTIGTDGEFFARALSGTAIIDDQTISGGAGNLGILDGSLTAADFEAAVIIETKIELEAFSGEHFPDSMITGVKVTTSSLDGSLFQTGILDSTEIGAQQLEARHLALSTLQTSKFVSATLLSEDFADKSIEGDHIISSSLPGSVFASAAILARHIAFETLDTDEFLSKTLKTEQILDDSLEHTDIATDQFENRHFQTSSVTTQKVTSAAVISSIIAPLTLRTDNFLDYSLETSDFASETIEGTNMVTGAVNTSHILDDDSGIATQNLSNSSLTFEKFADDSLDGSQVDTAGILSADILQLTITNRELGPASIDSARVENNTIENSRLAPAAITIDKIDDDAIADIDLADDSIIDRHISAGGSGDYTTFSGFSFSNRSNTPMAVFEDNIYLAGGLKINLHTKSTSTVSALLSTPLTASAFASNETTLYLFRNSVLSAFDFESETLYTVSTKTFANSNDTGAGGLLHKGDFYFLGGLGDHSGSVDKYSFSNDTWTNVQRMPLDITGSEAVSTGTTIYVFMGNEISEYDEGDDNWNSTNLGINFDFTGCDVIEYQEFFYLFGGKDDHSAIFRYDLSSGSLTQLTSQPFEIGSSNGGTNQVILAQSRFYIPSFSGTLDNSLILWHPRLDAAIGSEHIDSNAVTSSNLVSASLSSLVFGVDSIEGPEVVDSEVFNVDIEDNQLTTNSIAEEIFNSTHLKQAAVVSSKLASSSVDSRVIEDSSLEDEDFATDSIDSDALAIGSIGDEEVHPYAVTSAKLSADSISLAKVAFDSIKGEDIVDQEIKTVDIADLSMENSAFQTLVIEGRHVLDGEIRSEHLIDDSIIRVKIAIETLEEDVFSTASINAPTMVRDEDISAFHFAQEVLTESKVSTSPLEVLTNSRFQDNAVTSADISASAITESKVDTSAIQLSHIASQVLEDRSFADFAIQTDHLVDGLLSHFQFADKTLTTTDFANRSMVDDQFAADSIRSEHFINRSLHSDDFKDHSIGADLLPDSIDSSQILAQSLTSADFADDAIATHAFAVSVILSNHITSGTLTNQRFGDDQISEIKFRPDSLITQDLDSSSLDKDKILSKTLSGEHLITSNLSGLLLEDFTLKGQHFISGTIPSSKIGSAVLSGDSFAPFQVLTDHITNSEIKSEHITDLAITQEKLAPSDVFGSTQILDGSILGTSIVSFSLYNSDLAADSIRDDLIQTEVINQFQDLNESGSVYDAATSALNLFIADAIDVSGSSGEKLFYIFRRGQDAIETTSDFTSFPNQGTVPCTQIEDIFFLSRIQGYAVCTDLTLYFTDSSATSWSKVTQVPESVLDLHYFDLHTAVMMTRDSGSESIWYSSNSGRNWTRMVGPISDGLPWTIFSDTVAVPSQQETTTGKIYYSTNRGATFQSVVLDDGATTSSKVHGITLVRDGTELWGTIERDGSWDLAKFISFGASVQSKTPSGLQTSFQNSSPTMQPIEFHDKIYFFTETSTFGVWVYDIAEDSMVQILPAVAISSDASISDEDYLQSPVHLGESKILHRGSDLKAYTWEPNVYDHVLSASLTKSSLGSATLTSINFRRGSIENASFGTGVIGSTYLKSGGFTHGEFLEKTQVTQSFESLHGSDDGSILYAASGTSLSKSNDHGVSFSSLYTSPGETLTRIHFLDNYLISGTSSSNLILSTDGGVSFSRITSTPFQTDARLGFIHNPKSILAFGVNSSNEVQPAAYNSDLKAFLELKNSSLETVIVVSGTNGIYPAQVDFVDGDTGYLGVYRPGTGDYLFKTQDGGFSWSSIETSISSHIPVFQILEDGEFWLGYGENLHRYNSDSKASTTTIPDGSAIRGIHFLDANVGLLVTTAAAWVSYDGGASFSRFDILTQPPTDLVMLDQNEAVFSGPNLNLRRLKPQSTHQPLGALDSSVFSTSTKLQAVHFSSEGLTGADLDSGALQSGSIVDSHLDAEKLATSTINASQIESDSLDRHLFALESLTTAKFAADGVHGDNIRLEVLDTNHIIDGTITGAELANSILDSDSITDGSLSTDLIQDDSFFGSVLADQQILSTHLRDSSFSDSEFASSVFSAQHLQDQSLGTTHLSSPGFDLELEKVTLRSLTDNSLNSSQISSFHIEDDSIYAYLIESGSVSVDKLTDSAITEAKWRDDSIIRSLLALQVVSSSHVLSREVSGSHFLPATLSRSRFANTSIPSEKLTSYSFASREFVSGSLVAGKLSTTSGNLLTGSKLDTATVTSGTLGGTFATSYFADNSFTETKFDTAVITQSELSSNILTQGHFADLGIQGEDFGSDSIIRIKVLTNTGFAFAIAADAIHGSNVMSHELESAKFAGGIEGTKIANKVIFSSQLGTLAPTQVADHSIVGRVIKLEGLDDSSTSDNAFLTGHFSSGGLFSAVMADDLILLSNTQSAVLSSIHFKDNSLKGEDFLGFIPGSKISSQTLTGGEFVDEFLIGSAITSASLTQGRISSETLSARELLNHSLEAGNLSSNTFKDSAFKSAALTSSDFDSRVLSSTNITDASVETSQIETEEITGSHVAALNLNEDHFSDQSIDSSRIASRGTVEDGLGAVPQNRLDSGAITLAKLSTTQRIPAYKFDLHAILASSFQTQVVNSSHLIAESIDGSQFSTGINGNRITSDTLPANLLSSFGFTSIWIKDGTITERVLASSVLVNDHFASASILTTGIDDLTIPTSRFASSSITAGSIIDDSLEAVDFIANSLTGAHVSSRSLTADILALGNVESSKVDDDSLLWPHLEDGALHAVHLDGLVISTEHIFNSTVSLTLVTGQVSGVHILDGSLIGSEFATSIPGSKFAANSIAGDRFQSSTIDTSKFPTTIPRTKLADNTLRISKFNTSTTLFTDNSVVNSESVTGDDFQTNTIGEDRLSNRTLQSTDFSELLTSGTVPSLEVTSGKIQDGSITGVTLFKDSSNSSDTRLLNHTYLLDGLVDGSGIPASAIDKTHLLTSETNFQKLMDMGAGDNESHADFMHVHIRPALSCPTNYTNLSGNLEYCIRSADLTDTPENSVETCALDGQTQGHVCNFQEYTSACQADEASLNLDDGSSYLTSNYSTSKVLGFQPPGTGCQLLENPAAFSYSSASTAKFRCCLNN